MQCANKTIIIIYYYYFTIIIIAREFVFSGVAKGKYNNFCRMGCLEELHS